MISNEELQRRLMALDDVGHAMVQGDGYHYHVTLVSDRFEGQGTLARQQWVYAQLNDLIASGQIHALQMKTWTNLEWETQHG